MIESSALRRVVLVRRVAGACGIFSQLVAITALAVAISSSPWFSWTQDHLSVFGVGGSAKAIYNTGLILAGILSIIFAIGLGRCLLSGWPGQLATGFLILGSLAAFSMGVFPRTWDFAHGASTVAFYVCITAALVLAGVVAITAAQMMWGILSITAGVLVAAF